MAARVEIALTANGQALEVSAPVLADAAHNTIAARVALSEEWDGLKVTLAARNAETRKAYGSEVVQGAAVMPSAAVSDAGAVEVALIGYNGAQRLTTESRIITLHESGV